MRRLRPLVALHAGLMRRRKRGRPVGAILMYHRIAAPGVDPWRIAVRPEHFAEHLQVLKRIGDPVPLAALAADLPEVRDRSIAVTFDDGYADNLLVAKPLLDAAGVPATVFVVSGSVDVPGEFWWDALDRALLLPETLPGRLDLRLGVPSRRWELGTAAGGAWRAARGDAGDARMRLHYEVWKALRPLSAEVRQRAIDDLLEWAGGHHPPRASHRTMTAAELRELESDGRIAVGAHTVTHPFLPALSANDQREEMTVGRSQLERALGHAVSAFSYPWGGNSRTSVALAKAAGFSHAVTVDEETVWRQTDPFRIPRFAVRDWSGAEFESRLTSWFIRHGSA